MSALLSSCTSKFGLCLTDLDLGCMPQESLQVLAFFTWLTIQSRMLECSSRMQVHMQTLSVSHNNDGLMQASRQVAAALSSGDSQEVRQALRAAVMAVSSNLSPGDNAEVSSDRVFPVRAPIARSCREAIVAASVCSHSAAWVGSGLHHKGHIKQQP